MGANEMLGQIDDGTLTYLPVASIRQREGFNPRRYFDPEKMRELVESVRNQGVVQPIVVRAKEGGEYEVIAGERRLRAARTVGLEEIPALLRAVSEVEAINIALIENLHRDDLGPSEEAQKARDYLTVCDGDREEVCRRLGWSTRTLESRLLLLNCTDAVLTALDERRISLGHGELLATLPAETQDGTLAKIIDQRIGVAQLRERIQGIARSLETATFDLADCQGCPHNSSVQASLFDDNIGAGKCSNPKCFGERTVVAMAALKASLSKTYPAVWLDTERAPDTYAVLEKDGPKGVGSAQLDGGCKQCANFGAVVVTAPGREGKLIEDVCFDLGCRSTKIGAFAQLKAQGNTTVEKTTDSPAGKASGKTPAKLANASPGAIPKTVLSRIDDQLRRVAADVSLEDPRVRRAVRLYATWRDAEFVDGKTIGCDELPDKGRMTQRNKWIAEVVGWDESRCERVEAALIAYILKDLKSASESDGWAHTAASIIAATETEVSGRLQVNEDLLLAHRKSGMVALLREAGFDTWYDAKHGTAAFARLGGKKIDDIVAAAMEKNGFDWTTFVPVAVRDRMAKLV